MVWFGDKFNMSKYYAFCDRIAREYHGIWKKHGDPMHLNREDILLSIIPKVLRQIRPVVTTPKGYKDILQVVQPLIETTFTMPGPSSFLMPGSKQWIQKKIADNDYTFAEAVRYEDIMNAYVQKSFVQGDDRGYPHNTTW